jgi:hypothetical protein
VSDLPCLRLWNILPALSSSPVDFVREKKRGWSDRVRGSLDMRHAACNHASHYASGGEGAVIPACGSGARENQRPFVISFLSNLEYISTCDDLCRTCAPIPHNHDTHHAILAPGCVCAAELVDALATAVADLRSSVTIATPLFRDDTTEVDRAPAEYSKMVRCTIFLLSYVS